VAPIAVPVPGLVVLIGAAGSGKSTLAARLFAPRELVSSDQLREAVSGDAADQRATRPAFAILHREVRRRLDAGRLVVVDATNVERSARLSLVRIARAAGAPSIAIALAVPAAEAHARNAGRTGRVVPADVVDRHLDRLAGLGDTPAAITDALLIEGFSAATVLSTLSDLATARVVRRVPVPLSPP
jgi:protein phosphatase